MDKVKELLGVLDLDADHRFWAVQKDLLPDDAEMYDTGKISVADLAFRLRDEMFQSAKGKAAWCQGCRIVIETVNNSDEFAVWSQPIHWIIAALIAKELPTEN